MVYLVVLSYQPNDKLSKCLVRLKRGSTGKVQQLLMAETAKINAAEPLPRVREGFPLSLIHLPRPRQQVTAKQVEDETQRLIPFTVMVVNTKEEIDKEIPEAIFRSPSTRLYAGVKCGARARVANEGEILESHQLVCAVSTTSTASVGQHTHTQAITAENALERLTTCGWRVLKMQRGECECECECEYECAVVCCGVVLAGEDNVLYSTVLYLLSLTKVVALTLALPYLSRHRHNTCDR